MSKSRHGDFVSISTRKHIATHELPYDRLIDKAARWPKFGMANYHLFKHSKHLKLFVHNYARMLKTLCDTPAHTVFMSDDLVWATTKLSIDADPSWLRDQFLAARFPHDVMIFEWDITARYRCFVEFGADIQKEPVTPGERCADIVMTFSRGKQVMFTSYVPDLGLAIYPTSVFTGDLLPNRQYQTMREWMEMQHVPDGNAWEAKYLYTSPVVEKHPELLIPHPNVHVTWEGPLGVYFRTKPLEHGEWLQTSLSDTAGVFRWMAALAAILNRPASVRYVQSPPNTAHAPTPHAPTQTTMTLMLPRERLVNLLAKHRPRAPLKQAHEVDGHWAHSHTRGDPSCDHKWPPTHTRRQVCDVCGALRWWRIGHKRGPGELTHPRVKIMDYSGINPKELTP